MDDEGIRIRNRLGAATFVIAVVGALFAIFPATAPLGGLLCLAAVVPAIVAMRRVRRGTADARRRSAAAMVVAPLFFAVAVAVTPHPPVTAAVAEPAAAVVVPAAAPVGPAAVGRAAAAEPVAAVPAVAAPVVAAPAAVDVPLRKSSPVKSPAAPQKIVAAAAPAPAAAPRPAPAGVAAPRPAAPKPAAPGASCPTADHYVNSSGACVLRPVQAATAPAGATARCKDSTYSFSQTHSGTCSRHGGVSRWL